MSLVDWKPICDFVGGGLCIGNGIAHSGVVDQIVIDYFVCTSNACNCWCYSNHYDKTDILINNPFVVACDTKNGCLKIIDCAMYNS